MSNRLLKSAKGTQEVRLRYRVCYLAVSEGVAVAWLATVHSSTPAHQCWSAVPTATCVEELLWGPKNKQRTYAPFWSCALSPRHRCAELAGALLLESGANGHRAWPQACMDTYQGKERETGGGGVGGKHTQTDTRLSVKRDIQKKKHTGQTQHNTNVYVSTA